MNVPTCLLVYARFGSLELDGFRIHQTLIGGRRFQTAEGRPKKETWQPNSSSLKPCRRSPVVVMILEVMRHCGDNPLNISFCGKRP